MNDFLKKLLPWHVRQSLAWARYFYAKRKPPFRGVYTRFGEVPVTPAWHAARWTESSRYHAEKWRRQIGAAMPESSQPSKALLPVLVAAMAALSTKGRPVRILDFGGAGGLDFAQLLAALGGGNDLDLRYHVVDMPESCAAGESVWADDPRISFSAKLPEPSERFDIVYAFGAVHMVEDMRSLLAAFAAYEPAFMLFGKTSMYEGDSFVRRQVNMGGEMENPQWALGFRDFTGLMASLGYELTHRGYGEDTYNVDNYDPAHQAGRTVNLLFRRR
jgi:putative methyltransferase (TIGR04325 family)